ncbi:MAG TPA: hypothetical protein VKU89_05140 [Solirubrobacteraceae bacterium]|nr:hypothetical protein [Solirubrobacteraceae bacterium]
MALIIGDRANAQAAAAILPPVAAIAQRQQQAASGRQRARGARQSPGARLPFAALALAAALLAGWLALSARTPDLAAQYYRLWLYRHVGFALYDANWYAGHAIPGYSLLYQPLAALIGLRATGALAILCSVALFGAILRSLYGRGVPSAELFFAVAAAGDAWIGRLTFALGVTFALAAVLCLLRSRQARRRARRALRASSGCCALLCAASSPVAALLLAFGGASYGLATLLYEHGGRRRARALASYVGPLVWPAVLASVALEALFPEGGFEPYGGQSLLVALLVCAAFVVALPRSARVLAIAGLLYAAANILCEIPTPMGSNVVRYGVLLAGPLLLAALYGGGGEGARGLSTSRVGRAGALIALVGIASWVLYGPITQTLEVVGEASVRGAFYRPLERYLEEHVRGPVRIEVPFTRSHWEAALLAPRYALARGWERQLDKRYNEALESPSLSPAFYRSWLDRNGVSYVALPAVPFDESSFPEVRLIRRGLPYLREVLRTRSWRIFAVADPAPLVVPLTAGGGAQLTQMGHESFTVRVDRPGSYLVKLHYTTYWRVRSGSVQLREGPEGFTELVARSAGTAQVGVSFSPAGAAAALLSFAKLL